MKKQKLMVVSVLGYKAVNEMIDQGWFVKKQDVVQGFSAGDGYIEPKLAVLLEKDSND